jgi:hypothetical protein
VLLCINVVQDCFKHFKTKAEKKECGMCRYAPHTHTHTPPHHLLLNFYLNSLSLPRAEVTADFIKTAKYNEYLVDILATLFPNFQLPPGHKVTPHTTHTHTHTTHTHTHTHTTHTRHNEPID